MRDIIVVGAGPGGSAVAKHLAKKGYDVAVYEKRQEIGAPKRCAEGIAANDLRSLGIEVPENCLRQAINGASVYAPDGRSVNISIINDAGYVLERKVFDKWLAEEAVKAGAYIRAKTTITGVLRENGKICGVRGIFMNEPFEENCRVLVAADGIESKVSRMAGLNTTCKPSLTDSGFQYEMAGIHIDDPKKLYLFFGNSIAPRGYVWIFPKGEGVANVGIGIHGSSDISARAYLDKFIKGHPWLKDGSILEVNSGGIPVGGFMKKMALDNFLAIGDAAHQVNPIHGGGIYEAQYAAKIAADVISDALEKGDTSEKALDEYNKRWWSERGNSLVKVEKLRELIEKLSDDDLNFLAESLDGQNLMDFCKGRNLGIIGRLIVKRPHLVKYAGSLV